MKRFLVLAICAFCTLSSFAQNKKSFLGLYLGEHYSLNEAQSIIDGQCENSKIDKENISAGSCRFGGYQWSWVDFKFYRNGLCFIEFSQYFNTEENAAARYDSIITVLVKKYGCGIGENGENYESFDFFPNRGGVYICKIEKMLAESKGGKRLWYVMLSYHDENLYYDMLKAEEDEL